MTGKFKHHTRKVSLKVSSTELQDLAMFLNAVSKCEEQDYNRKAIISSLKEWGKDNETKFFRGESCNLVFKESQLFAFLSIKYFNLHPSYIPTFQTAYSELHRISVNICESTSNPQLLEA